MSTTCVKCIECLRVFSAKKNLYAHIRKFHKDTLEIIKTEPDPALRVKCSVCSKLFSNTYSLKRHFKSHNENGDHTYSNESQKSSRLLCPQESCDEKCPNYRSLRIHLSDVHSLEIENEELEFNSLEEFENWKDKMQRQTYSSYVRNTAPKQLAADTKKQYFNCHRSDFYMPKGNGLRTLKVTGSNKIGKACPSRIEVTTTEHKGKQSIKVHFYKTHCGHALDLSYIALDKKSRTEIAGKLKEGVTFDQILDSVRDEESNEIGTKSRKSVINRKDLYNIARDYEIDYTKQLVKNAPKQSSQRITASHKLSRNITPEMITVVGDNEWLVCNTKDCTKQYQVSFFNIICSPTCLQCNICKICVHSFKCTCTDNLAKLSICRHIHACAQHFDCSSTSEHELDKMKNDNAIEIENLPEMCDSPTNINSNSNIIKKAQLIVELSNNSSTTQEEYLKIEEYLDKIIHVLNKNNVAYVETTETVNVEKENEKQEDLHLTKRQRVH